MCYNAPLPPHIYTFPTRRSSDLTATVRRDTSIEELNDAFRTAAAGPMQGILGVSDEPLVSMDFKGDSRSSDRKSTRLNSSHLVISYAVFCLKKKSDVGHSAKEGC